MATTFPTSIQDLDATRGSNNDKLSSPNHVTHHTTEDDTIEALQAKVGVDGSAVTTSHDYKLGEVTGSDKAVGKTATQTLTNKTLTSPVINVGSDAEGDTYYRNSSGVLVRLPRGTDNYIMKMNGNVPNWEAETVNSDGSYSTKGILQGLTDAATSGLTISSGVISVNDGTTANKIVKLNSSAQIPAVDGSLLTNISVYAPNTDITATYYTFQVPMNVTSTTAITNWTVGGTGSFSSDGAASFAVLAGASSFELSSNIFSPLGSLSNYDYSKVLRYKALIKLTQATSDRKGWGLCVTAANIHTAQTDTTNGEIRFILNGSTFYAQNANGSAATSTDISSGITLTNWNLFEFVFTPSTDIKFYINGTLKATHTTNLPTTATARLAYGVNTNGWGIYSVPPIITIGL